MEKQVIKTSGNAPAVIQNILSSIQQMGDIQRVFGQPVIEGERTVIPIAEVSLFFGAGFGDGDKSGLRKSSSKRGSGGGIGGRVKSVPVGALEISSQGTRFVPVFHPGKSLFLLALGLLLGGWAARSKQAKIQKKLQKIQSAQLPDSETNAEHK